ncbi:hypothetical protein P280DRAFT_518759 [Massarina eburnea CBS 473.64]|uniref:Uncharacterized protein n=1 Tax=Massarina eburnea CBS 473.64 TaxID=1395130 RepID=A0A6A6S1N4_9PLEO|nr:hypothetical protein P280DRAFT_518759 [Massarina eburnea CBS 473.64]
MATPQVQDPSIPSEDGICHFMRLPQELRDMIYEYSLTESTNLRIFHSGQDRYELIPESLYPVRSVDRAAAASPTSKRKRRADETYTDNHVSLGSDAGKVVLRPREHPEAPSPKRMNMHHDEGSEDPIVLPRFPLSRETNQLQYVSKQLRRETGGLGIRYNTLCMQGFTSASALILFQIFIRGLPHALRKRIRGLYLNEYVIVPPNHMGHWPLRQRQTTTNAVIWCQHYPQMQLKLRLPWLVRYLRLDALLFLAYCVDTVIGRNNAFMQRIHLSPSHQQRYNLWMNLPDVVQHLQNLRAVLVQAPPNFRFYPVEATFDAERYRKARRDNGTADGDIEFEVTMLEDIHENGI